MLQFHYLEAATECCQSPWAAAETHTDHSKAYSTAALHLPNPIPKTHIRLKATTSLLNYWQIWKKKKSTAVLRAANPQPNFPINKGCFFQNCVAALFLFLTGQKDTKITALSFHQLSKMPVPRANLLIHSTSCTIPHLCRASKRLPWNPRILFLPSLKPRLVCLVFHLKNTSS